MAKLVSKTYGDALFEVAAEENRMDALLDEADGILTVLRENAGLSKVMTHPKIVKEEKLDLIDHIFQRTGIRRNGRSDADDRRKGTFWRT